MTLSISPDGAWLAGVNKDGALCIYTTDPLHEERCTLLDACQADPRSVAWALDSRRVAVDGGTENVLLTLDRVEFFAGPGPGHGLDWAGNDTLLLPFSHLLLRVGVE